MLPKNFTNKLKHSS